MRTLLADFRRTTEGRPLFAAVLILYVLIIPAMLCATAIFSFFQRSDLSREAHRNCQRSVAIADYIHDVVPAKIRLQKNPPPPIARLLDLERQLRAIGRCQK